jgi:hypothetical protein
LGTQVLQALLAVLAVFAVFAATHNPLMEHGKQSFPAVRAQAERLCKNPA